MLRLRTFLPAALAVSLTAGACTPPPPAPDLLAPVEEQSRTRSYQSREFDTADRTRTMRAVLGVLQDLGFIIERANDGLGLVTAARFQDGSYGSMLAVTVTVRPLEGDRCLVRANAVYNLRPVRDPEVYQQFFTALQRSLMLTGDGR